MHLPLDAVVPLGIMLHELVARIRYLHTANKGGEAASFSLTGRVQDGSYSLTVHGSENLPIHAAISDAHELLSALTEQLGAEAEALENGCRLVFSADAVACSELARLSPAPGPG